MASGNDLKAYWPMPDFFLHDADASTRMAAWLALPVMLRDDLVRMSEGASKDASSWGTSFRDGMTAASAEGILRFSTLPRLKSLVDGNEQLKAAFAASLADSEAAARRLLVMMGANDDGLLQVRSREHAGPAIFQCNVCHQTIGPQEGYVAYQRTEPPYEEYGHTCGDCQQRQEQHFSRKQSPKLEAQGRRALPDHRMERPVRVLEHSAVCRNAACPSNSCRRVKDMHQHVQTCPNSTGKCQECASYFYLLRLHALQCTVPERGCPVPWCWELKEVFVNHGGRRSSAAQAAAPTSVEQFRGSAPLQREIVAQVATSVGEDDMRQPNAVGGEAPTAHALRLEPPAFLTDSADASMHAPKSTALKSEALRPAENNLDAEMAE